MDRGPEREQRPIVGSEGFQKICREWERKSLYDLPATSFESQLQEIVTSAIHLVGKVEHAKLQELVQSRRLHYLHVSL